MSFFLPCRCPNGGHLEVEVEPTDTIQEVQDKICDKERLFPRGRIALYLNETKLQINNTVREYPLKPSVLPPENGVEVKRPTVKIILLLGKPEALIREDSTYESFIDLSIPAHGDKELPLNIQPLIKFKKSATGHMVYLPSLADISALPASGDGNMREYLGEEISSSLGFIKWTETSYPFRCFLLEIDNEEILPNLKSRIYSSFTNNVGYTNGDRHSWQRYTRARPVDAYVHVSEVDKSVRLLPTETLKPSTVYAIVLLNGVPVVSEDYLTMRKPLMSYWRPGICEDYLIIFRTKKPRMFEVPTIHGGGGGGSVAAESVMSDSQVEEEIHENITLQEA